MRNTEDGVQTKSANDTVGTGADIRWERGEKGPSVRDFPHDFCVLSLSLGQHSLDPEQKYIEVCYSVDICVAVPTMPPQPSPQSQ